MLNVDNNCSFKGVYTIYGAKASVDKLYSHIKTVNSFESRPTDYIDKLVGEKLNRIVLTDDFDILLKVNEQIGIAYAQAQEGIKVCADNFWQLVKEHNLLCFNAELGMLAKTVQIKGQKHKMVNLVGNDGSKILHSVILNKPKPILDTILEASRVESNSNFKFNKDTYLLETLNDVKEILPHSLKLKKLKSDGLLGYGVESVVFRIPKSFFEKNNKVIKFSLSPITPQKVYPDIENKILDSGIIEHNGKKLYCHIQPEAQGVPTAEQMKKVIDKAKQLGLTLTDIHSPERQMGLINGKAVLIDSGCIENRAFKM